MMDDAYPYVNERWVSIKICCKCVMIIDLKVTWYDHIWTSLNFVVIDGHDNSVTCHNYCTQDELSL